MRTEIRPEVGGSVLLYGDWSREDEAARSREQEARQPAHVSPGA
ncbi:MAG: hypothetical protein QXR20_05350 [Candidatus Caldarchaeum sp.]